jgi:hypothetical protein
MERNRKNNQLHSELVSYKSPTVEDTKRSLHWDQAQPQSSQGDQVCGLLSHAKCKAKKFDPKATTIPLVSYDKSSKAYKCYSPITCKIIISHDVRFDETNFDPKVTKQTKPLED